MRRSLLTATLSAVVLAAAAAALVDASELEGDADVCAENPYNVSEGDIKHICARFCSGKCAFLNRTADPEDPDRLHGDTGKPSTLSLYRVTPWNVTSIANKDTGNPPGDMSFYFQNKGNGASSEDFLNGFNVFAQFSVDVDGQWGAYKQCNPIDKHADPTKPHDNFVCEHDCIDPPRCSARSYESGKGELAPIYCVCDHTGRDNSTVGRADMAHAFQQHKPPPPPPTSSVMPRRLQHGPPMPPMPPGFWACSAAVEKAGCSGHSYPPAPAADCERCAAKSAAVQAACPDKAFIQHTCAPDVFGCEAAIGKHCPHAGTKQGSEQCLACALSPKATPFLEAANCSLMFMDYICGANHHSWVSLGGFWYNTQAEGQCKGDATPADSSSCSWKAKPIKYCNETCVNARVDKVVEAAGPECFKACAQPHNTTSSCYLECYRVTLSGNSSATPPTKGMARKDILAPWLLAFTEDEPAKGGCPRYTPPDEMLAALPAPARHDYAAAAVRDPCAQWAAHRESACRDFDDDAACEAARASEVEACA